MALSLELSEHSSRVVPMDASDAAWLAREASDALSVELAGEGRYRLRTRQFVGVVVAPGIEVRITPKCPVGALFHMLSHAYGLVKIRSELSSYAAASNLYEFFVNLLVTHTEQLLRAGIRRSYRDERDNLRVVRGRVDVRQCAVAVLRGEPRIRCEFEELSEDVFDNQVIRYTLERLQRLHPGSQALRARARRLKRALSRVSVRPFSGKDIERRNYDRLSAHYQPIHGLCRLLLEACGLEAELGDRRAPGFLVDMNALFERFVLVRMQELSAPPLEIQGQRSLRLDLDRFVSIRPDILVSWAGTFAVVADTKYKRTDDEAVDNADVYQALAYARALGVRVAYLIYPNWESDSRRIRLRDGANDVVVATVRLAEDAEGVDETMLNLLRGVRAAARDEAAGRWESAGLRDEAATNVPVGRGVRILHELL